MEHKGKISVIVHTYNSAATLEATLTSVARFDEVIVADMESTDQTLAIAAQHGCRTLSFPKNGYTIPEPYRQKAIDAALSEWVLVVDSDEVVPPALPDYLYEQISLPNPPSGLWIPRQNYFLGRFMHNGYPDYLLRFFRRRLAHWPTTIHSMPSVDGPTARIPQQRRDLALQHLCDTSISARMQKLNDYTQAELVRQRGKNRGAAALFYRPLWRFTKAYLLKKGFIDGVPGLINAMLEGCYQFVLVAKQIEEKYSKR